MARTDINALRQKRAKIAAEARAILDAASSEGLSGEEERRFDEFMEEADQLERRIERAERADALERSLDAIHGAGGDDLEPGDAAAGETARARAFSRWLVVGERGLSPDEQRALAVTPDEAGGHLVAPQQFVNELIQALDDMVEIRGLATGHQLTEAESLGVPTLDSDFDDWEWTTELGTGSESTGPTFGKREFRPHPMAKRIKVSRTLLRRASRNPEDIILERGAYKLGVTQEKAYMTGDGNQKPLGLFVASAAGIPTSRDSDVGASGTLPLTNSSVADQLIDAKYKLKTQYLANARWLFHRDTLKVIRKVKDSDGAYAWQPGLATDRPDTILSLPFVQSEFAPNTVTGGAYVGLLGDFRYYWYVDALDLDIQRLMELYAETNQVGFIFRYEGDGMPVLPEAFVRLKVAS